MPALLALLLLSCSSGPLPVLPPPPALQVGAAVPGGPLRLALDTGAPGARVAILLSRYRPEPGPCPPLLRGACLDLLQPRVIADQRADATGRFEVAVTVPADTAPGTVVALQAVAFLPGGPQPAAAMEVLVLAPHDDLDRDGLDALTEVSLGLLPLQADSDGGGTIDGQEVRVDRTDPLDSSDDLRVEQDCGDGIDGDGDGQRDCGDPDCACPEQCGNGVDDDHDRRLDCADVACIGHPSCAEVCNDRRDNDRDRFMDCADPDCAASLACERVCTNGSDDDQDGRTDCADADCSGLPGCPRGREVCNDGIDNNGNGLADCADVNCSGLAVCLEDCANGVDDDGDSAVDCLDPDCRVIFGSYYVVCEEDCLDGVDNNHDGYVDGADPRCFAYAEVCGNGLDDDGDGFVDCADYDCAGACFERCDNGVDDDWDGDADCADDACEAWCREACDDHVDNDGDGLLDCQDTDCAGRCVERCGNGSDDDFDLRADCADPDCACVERCTNGADDDQDGAIDCADPDCGPACGEVCDNGRDDDADGLADCEDGSCTDLCVEDCSNGMDDDGDFWVDCQDEECWSEPACPAAERVAWVTGGHLRAVTWRDAGSAFCGRSGFSWGDEGTATQVRGSLWVNHAGREDLCTWQVERAFFAHVSILTGYMRYSSPWGPFSGRRWCDYTTWVRRDMQRTGFRVAPGCGFSTSGFLPDSLEARASCSGVLSSSVYPIWRNHPRRGRAEARIPGGGLWYDGGADVGEHVHWSQISLPHEHEEVGRTGPMTPQTAWGTCATGVPVLVPAPDRLGGWEGVCLP
jgi:hypothetical protein